MQMHTRSYNKMRELEDFVNSANIPKENIISIFPNSDKTFTIVYYAED